MVFSLRFDFCTWRCGEVAVLLQAYVTFRRVRPWPEGEQRFSGFSSGGMPRKRVALQDSAEGGQ
jgi:hypothetical protein